MFRLGNINNVLLYFGMLYMRCSVKAGAVAMFDIKEFCCNPDDLVESVSGILHTLARKS